MYNEEQGWYTFTSPKLAHFYVDFYNFFAGALEAYQAYIEDAERPQTTKSGAKSTPALSWKVKKRAK